MTDSLPGNEDIDGRSLLWTILAIALLLFVGYHFSNTSIRRNFQSDLYQHLVDESSFTKWHESIVKAQNTGVSDDEIRKIFYHVMKHEYSQELLDKHSHLKPMTFLRQVHFKDRYDDK